jgi:REP element-mobilizing transposase RayT
MSEKYKIVPDGLYFVTLTTVGWIDIFTRAMYCDEIIKNLNYCIDNKGLKVFAFCIMHSHIHLIAKCDEGINLSDVLHDFKSYTAKRILKMIEESDAESRREWLLYMFEFYGKKSAHNVKYQFWQHNNHAFDLFSNKFIDQKVNYIHNNPVEARIVTEAHFYIYSSANEFTDLKLAEL